MPRMNGYDFFDAVRAVDTWVRIPFIFLTAKASVKISTRANRWAQTITSSNRLMPTICCSSRGKLKRYGQLQDVQHKEVSEIKHNILTILNMSCAHRSLTSGLCRYAAPRCG